MDHRDPRDDLGRRPAQVLRRLRGRQGHRRRGPPGRGVRLPRPQRRRQVLDHADDRRGQPGRRGRAADLRDGPRRRRTRDPRPARRLPPGGHPRQRAQRLRQPLHLRPLLRHRQGDRAGAHRRAAGVRVADRQGEVAGRGPLRRHEATAHDRPQPRQQPRHAAARRAHDRPRPAGAPRALGPAVPAQAGRRHAGHHDPLHGRGRAALRPAGRHGQGPDRRRGQPARADRRPLDARGRRAPVRRRRERGDVRQGRRPRRPGRGAARPGAGLHPRRRAGHRPGPRARATSPRRCWCAAPPSRTSSCASPAGAWSTDGHAHPRRGPLAPVRLLVDGLQAHLARQHRQQLHQPDLLRPRDGGAARRLHRGRPRPARGRDQLPRVHRARPGGRPRDADGGERDDVPRHGDDQVAADLRLDGRDPAADPRHRRRPPAVRAVPAGHHLRRLHARADAVRGLRDLVGAGAGLPLPAAGRHGLRLAGLRLDRPAAQRVRLRRAVPARRSSRCSSSPARSSRSPTSARRARGPPGSPRCGTASTCRGCSASTPSTGGWRWSTSPCCRRCWWSAGSGRSPA